MFRLVIRVALFAGWVVVLLSMMTFLKDFLLANVNFDFMTPSMCWFATKLHLFSLLSNFIAVLSTMYLRKIIFQYWTNS